MEDEPVLKIEFQEPARMLVGPVKVNFALRLRREVMREALHFESGPAAHHKLGLEQRLQRYHYAFPRNTSSCGFGRKRGRPAVDAAGDSIEPAPGNVLLAQGTVVAVLFQPSRIYHHPIR